MDSLADAHVVDEPEEPLQKTTTETAYNEPNDDGTTESALPDWMSIPINKKPADTESAKSIIQALQSNSINPCVVGTKALSYFGADRVGSWEFCVPTDLLSTAAAIFETSPDFMPWRGYNFERDVVPPQSLHHTFPRFRSKNSTFNFFLVPSSDYRLDCRPINFEYSAQQKIPYPKLHLFAQSLFETQRFVDLQDLVDGMDLTLEWGEMNLKYDTDEAEYVAYGMEKNKRILASLPQEYLDDPVYKETGSTGLELHEGMGDFREVFERDVNTKSKRVGLEWPAGTFVTKYRARGSLDPRLEERYYV